MLRCFKSDRGLWVMTEELSGMYWQLKDRWSDIATLPLSDLEVCDVIEEIPLSEARALLANWPEGLAALERLVEDEQRQPGTGESSGSPLAVDDCALAGDYSPAFQTERFDVFKVHIVRNPALGDGRDVYMAWFRDEDVPRPICEVTLDTNGIGEFANYVEWCHVCEQYRRRGIATEVLRGLEKHVGELTMDGATDAGDALCDSFCEPTPAASLPDSIPSESTPTP